MVNKYNYCVYNVKKILSVHAGFFFFVVDDVAFFVLFFIYFIFIFYLSPCLHFKPGKFHSANTLMLYGLNNN